jgi:hypothetical protein
MTYREYSVSVKDKQPLLDFVADALRSSGCTPIHVSPTNRAPYRITFEAPSGERMGVIAYVFFANNKEIRNRPKDEHRFQIKYGSDFSGLHNIWQDPSGLYTTLLFGVNPDRGFLVGADPILNNPTRFSVSKEFKEQHVSEVVSRGWHSWERLHYPAEVAGADETLEATEILVGATRENFLRYVLFEREALSEDQGHRQLLAEQFGSTVGPISPGALEELPILSKSHVHMLEREFELSRDEILDLIDSAPRLKMAVRGWVAEQHLLRQLQQLPDVDACEKIAGEGKPDVLFRFSSGRPLRIECKNVLRKARRDGLPRLDFMRMREAKTDPCRRYYSPQEFDVVAACLHPQTQKWSFKMRETQGMREHRKCPGKLDQKVIVGADWSDDLFHVLRRASAS